MGVAYGEKSGLNNYKLSTEDIEMFVNHILMPLCKNEKTGEMLSIEECCKNLSLITFFTFCHGNTEVGNILSMFNEKLAEKGLTDKDRKVLTKSFFEVNYAKETSTVFCPTISTASVADSIGPMFNFWYFGDDSSELLKNHYAMICDKPGQFCGKDWVRPQEKKFGAITIIAYSILNSNLNADSEGVVSEEHKIGHFKEVENGLNTQLNEEAMSTSLKRRIENSILNQTQNKYVQFTLQELHTHLDEILPKKNRFSDLSQEVCL